MRKLFVVGIICLSMLIACQFYLNYDLKRFEREYLEGPAVQQEGVADPAVQQEGVVDPVFVPNENKYNALETNEDSILPISTQEKSISLDENTTNKGSEPQHTQLNTDLSPKLKKLFKGYYTIFKEIEKIDRWELNPLLEQHSKVRERQEEIRNQLAVGQDEATVGTLSIELQELQDWQTKYSPKILELQDAVDKIYEKQSNFLKEQGFSSQEHFWKTHEDAYQAWVSEHQ